MALVRRVAEPLSVELACVDFFVDVKTLAWRLWENRYTGLLRVDGLSDPPSPAINE